MVALLLAAAEAAPGQALLDPCAGDGALLAGIATRYRPDQFAALHFCEADPARYAALVAVGYTPQPRVARDFLVPGPWDQDWRYHTIVGVPPFAANQDCRTIVKAHDWLALGGRLALLCSEHPFRATRDPDAQQFLFWLSSVGGITEPLPDDTLVRDGQPVPVRLVIIDK